MIYCFHGNYLHDLLRKKVHINFTPLPIIWPQNTEWNCHRWDNIQELQNSLVFIWYDMLPQKLLPWFFLPEHVHWIASFLKLTVIKTFLAVTHVVILCYPWIMHKIILTFEIFFPWQPDMSHRVLHSYNAYMQK